MDALPLPERARDRLLECSGIVEYGNLNWGHRFVRSRGFEGPYVLLDTDNKVEPVDGLTVINGIEQLPPVIPEGDWAFLSLWTLGNAPKWVRNTLMPSLSRAAVYSVVFNDTVGGFDNASFFERWRNQLGPGLKWDEAPVSGSARHLLGVRN